MAMGSTGVVLGLMLVAGCHRARAVPSLPQQAAGWTLEGAPQPYVELIPVARAAWQARYAGNPPVVLTVYEMPSETSAFDALQKWRPGAGKLAFYKGRYFAIAESAGADFRTLNIFVVGIQSSWNP